MKINGWLAICLALATILALHNLALAAGPEDGPDQDGGRRVGLTSTAVECLVVNAGALDSASATVSLEWEGRVDEAFLVLSAAGSRGEHSIYVNGQRVGRAPFRPGGRPCQAESAVGIPVPTDVLVNGDNVIVLTNDANINDGWTAAELYLEIHGDLTLPLLTPWQGPPSPLFSSQVGATAVITGYEWLTSSYDGTPHRVWYQVPDVYNPATPLPLLIVMHGWDGNGEDMLEFMGADVNERGWLLTAPDTHGAYYLNGKRAMAWPGAQRDVLDAVEYMVSTYAVDTSRIYVTGPSMGGHDTTVMAAKYPDVFAAAVEWAGFTDVADWYVELYDLDQQPGYYQEWRLKQIRREIDPGCNPEADTDFEQGCGTPPERPFEYQRRSAMEMPQNSRLFPLKIWADVEDILVDVHHARDLRDAINSWDPPTPVTLIEVEGGCNTPSNHCYFPDFDEVFDFLAGFTLNSQPPLSLTIRTDESKFYYWLNVAQTGGDHWSEVEAACSVADKAVTATISDTQPLTLAFNLGSTPMTGVAGINRPGLGLPATTYLVKGGGIYTLTNYTSGYLTTTLTATGQLTLTISAIEAQLSADPPMVSGGHPATSTITAVVKDRLNNPVPDGTAVRFSTSEGTFPNAGSAYTATVRTGGQATATLALAPDSDSAEIIASVEGVTASTWVEVSRPSIDVLVTPDRTAIYKGYAVTYTYQITNTGNITLTAVTLVDDNGTPGDGSDDFTVCTDVTLTAGAAREYSRSATLDEHTTITATVTGQDPLGNKVTEFDLAAVSVISPAIDLSVTVHPTIIGVGELVTYTYQITNTGDVTLTNVTVIDDNGTPGDGSDDFAVCEYPALLAGPEAVKICNYSAVLTQTTTHVAVVTGRDPLGLDVTDSDSTTVMVGVQIYLPIVTKNGAP